MRRLASAPVFATRYRRVAYWWAGTRLLLLLWALGVAPYFSRGAVVGDVSKYATWAQTIMHGSFPVTDSEWQYPPGAALVMLVPQVFTYLHLSYLTAFFLFALAADAAVFLLLLGQADRVARESAAEPHQSGVWAWVGGGLALGPIVLMRYDGIVTTLAVAGLIVTIRSTATRSASKAENRTWALRGALLGLGAIVKVWPAVLLLGLTPGKQGRRALAWAAASALAVTGALSALLPGALSFLGGQSNRGIEVESVLASPFSIASWFGYPARTVHEYGAFQVAGPGTAVLGSGAIVLTVLGFGAVLYWRVRRARTLPWTPALMYDIGLTVVLIMVVTSRVLSPQYLIWLMGLAALCIAEDGPARRATLMAWPARMVMACVLVTQIEFPLLFGQVLHHGFWGTALVAVRNIVLLASTWLALRALWRATGAPALPPPSAAEPDPISVAGAELTTDLQLLEVGASTTPVDAQSGGAQ
jgi:hypothetical protein